MNRKKVLLGMSGGVDSSAAAIVLKNNGYEVIGITMKLFDSDEANVLDAKKVCDALKIKHYVCDYSKEFSEVVINNFIEQYKDGKTPNPCIVCNKYFKFGRMLEEAKKIGADHIATGHYAQIEFDGLKYHLKKSNANKKDQTYVLYNMTQEILSHTIFPLGNFENKEEIRKLVQENELSIANKPDSQEICFISDNDYANFIEKKIGKFKIGNFVDKNGNVLGKHKGIINYTVGQRKGLGISNSEPLFVIKINKNKNEVVLGKEEDLYVKELLATDMNYISGDIIDKPFECKAKIRYSAKEVECTVIPDETQKAKIIFNEAQRAVTPGQSVVLYNGEYILGGGLIES